MRRDTLTRKAKSSLFRLTVVVFTHCTLVDLDMHHFANTFSLHAISVLTSEVEHMIATHSAYGLLFYLLNWSKPHFFDFFASVKIMSVSKRCRTDVDGKIEQSKCMSANRTKIFAAVVSMPACSAQSFWAQLLLLQYHFFHITGTDIVCGLISISLDCFMIRWNNCRFFYIIPKLTHIRRA